MHPLNNENASLAAGLFKKYDIGIGEPVEKLNGKILLAVANCAAQ